MAKYLQLYLPCFGGNKFGNSIERVFRLNELVESLNSLYP